MNWLKSGLNSLTASIAGAKPKVDSSAQTQNTKTICTDLETGQNTLIDGHFKRRFSVRTGFIIVHVERAYDL
jgi:hypothetical protein